MKDRLIELLQEASAEAGKYFRETTKKVLAEKGRFNSAEDIDRRNIYEVEADYLLANGVIVPPCKVGDKVYTIFCNKVDEGVVVSCEYSRALGFSHMSSNGSFPTLFKEDNVGKAVFLTREEAEAKLKEGVQE